MTLTIGPRPTGGVSDWGLTCHEGKLAHVVAADGGEDSAGGGGCEGGDAHGANLLELGFSEAHSRHTPPGLPVVGQTPSQQTTHVGGEENTKWPYIRQL